MLNDKPHIHLIQIFDYPVFNRNLVLFKILWNLLRRNSEVYSMFAISFTHKITII